MNANLMRQVQWVFQGSPREPSEMLDREAKSRRRRLSRHRSRPERQLMSSLASRNASDGSRQDIVFVLVAPSGG
jgi:hypothetical protein